MRHLRFLLVALATATAALPAWAGAALDRVMQTGTLVLASEEDFPPQVFVNERKELVGFNIDVAREIARRLGVALKIETVDWESIVAGRWGERWDISVGSMAPTRSRAQRLDFPTVYYYAPASFAVHVASSIRSLADLNDKRIGVCTGCVYEDYLLGALTIDAAGTPPVEYTVTPGLIRHYDTDTTALDDLRAGDTGPVQAVLTTLPTIQVAIRTGYPVRVIEPPAFHEPAAIAIDKGDDAFADRLSVIIAGMRADGTLAALSMRWYGLDLTRPPAR